METLEDLMRNKDPEFLRLVAMEKRIIEAVERACEPSRFAAVTWIKQRIWSRIVGFVVRRYVYWAGGRRTPSGG